MTLPEFRLRSLFTLTAIVAVGCCACRFAWIVVLFLGPLTPALFIGLWRGWRVTISSRPALQTSSKKGGNDAQS